jgi:hypothetical protein
MSEQTPNVGFQRPSIRQRSSRAGVRLWVRELRCCCGWTRTVGGNAETALAAADDHWHARHRPGRRPA